MKKSAAKSPRKAPPAKPLRVTWSGLNALVVMAERGHLALEGSKATGLLRAGLIEIEDPDGAYRPTFLGRDVIAGKIPVRIVGKISTRWTVADAAELLKRWSETGIMIISRTGGKR